MSQAIVDPAELRRFASNLKKFHTELEGQMKSLHGQMSALSQTWRDREHQKFVEEFDQAAQAISRSMEMVHAYIPFLLRKAERIEEYLQQR
jgi:WXG100 family type VII secretion target